MGKADKLRDGLREFDSIKKDELDLAPIEKWMVRKLGVKREPARGGSAVRYSHPILKKLGRDGVFTVHKKHKKKEKITRFDYKTYLRPRICEIIELMGKEETSDKSN